MKPYTFPFDTCEVPYTHTNKIAQPFSFVVNLISCSILLYALLISQDIYIKIFFGLLLLFEAIHTYSHFKHVHGYIQINTIHVVAYLVNISYLLIFINLTQEVPSIAFWIIYFGIIILDVLFFTKNIFLGYFTTQLSLIALTNIYYYTFIIQNVPSYYLYMLFILIILLIGLFINEKNNCKKMIEQRKFPYHVIVESIGVIIFLIYVTILLKLDRVYKKLLVEKMM